MKAFTSKYHARNNKKNVRLRICFEELHFEPAVALFFENKYFFLDNFCLIHD
jgi:hypothetical protein